MRATRLPSRRMARKTKQSFVPLAGFLSTVTVGFGYFVYASSPWVVGVTSALVCAFCVWSSVLNRREKHRLQTLASARQGESICDFARSFDTRRTDTWIIRAVYQELQPFFRPVVPFPIRATDSLLDISHLDHDDVDDLIAEVALRAGRSIEQTECNPYYGKVRTISDAVHFVNAQPPVRRP